MRAEKAGAAGNQNACFKMQVLTPVSSGRRGVISFAGEEGVSHRIRHRHAPITESYQPSPNPILFQH